MENPTDSYAATAKAASAGVVIWQFLALLVIVLILTRFFARQTKELTAPVSSKEVWGRIATGFLWLVLNPVLIGVAIVTIIGLPLALVMLFFYLVLIIIAYAITPILLGALINRKVRLYDGKDEDIWKDFILGYIVIQIIALVPILGGLFIFFLFLFAFGRVAKYVFEIFKRNR
jgi:small-conductance mechanosensitive channel